MKLLFEFPSGEKAPAPPDNQAKAHNPGAPMKKGKGGGKSEAFLKARAAYDLETRRHSGRPRRGRMHHRRDRRRLRDRKRRHGKKKKKSSKKHHKKTKGKKKSHHKKGKKKSHRKKGKKHGKKKHHKNKQGHSKIQNSKKHHQKRQLSDRTSNQTEDVDPSRAVAGVGEPARHAWGRDRFPTEHQQQQQPQQQLEPRQQRVSDRQGEQQQQQQQQQQDQEGPLQAGGRERVQNNALPRRQV